ncbi:type VI secretion system protein ImpL [Frischella perrara]|uniref:Type VI secretion protein IcmF n=1 Tax=Frischella perrara TaxID=1267021 RepID=A0A0A7S8G2_FRIPE|nr:type VI secretion system membrane subunit TssM [Frischella perrara]AJA45571.1 type VI secretion protein IcmF [Frischella perrara]PWV58976.1 type VI secretion system protein ImpL [Frischella perrara]
MKLLSIPKPKLPNISTKKTLVYSIVVLWAMALLWLWTLGTDFEILQIKPFDSIYKRWLITLISTVCLMIWFTVFLIRKLRRLNSLQLQMKKEQKDPLQIEINTQSRYLSRWLLRLQKQLVVKNFRYKLPWYLVIGNVNSGKTTFLKEGCKLNELYTPEIPQLVHCWLNESAVIIESKGQLFEQDNNSTLPTLYERLWKGMLEWLVNERNRQPLNGMILTIDIYQLSTFTKTERDNYITKLKARLDDIKKILDTQLPVYIVLTKLDLLYGFEAMYQSLDKNQREEVLGITFTYNEENWLNELDNFWQKWISHLNGAMPAMMVNNVDISQRSQLFTFIRQVYGIKDYVTHIIDNCFLSLKEGSFALRGVYLTSSQQKGQMEDLFVKSASSQYNLPEQIYPSWQSPISHTYFTHNLLNSLLFKETNLAGENKNYHNQSRYQLYRWGISSAVATCLLVIGWQYYYLQNYNSGDAVLVKAQEYMRIQLPDQKDYWGDLQLPLLNPISEATLAYGDYHRRNQYLSDLGLYQGYKIGPYVENTYLNLLQQRYMPAIMNGLQRDLNKAPEGSEQKLAILRIMRMIEDESGRDIKMVTQYMLSRWSVRFNGQSELQSQLHKHLTYALEHIKWKTSRNNNDQIAINSYLPFQQSIKDAQVDLRRIPVYQRVYQNLRAQSKTALPVDLNIRNQIGSGFNAVFYPENEKLLYIPQILTRSGLTNYFIHQDNRLIELTSLDSWVLEITPNVKYSEEDRKEIQHHITTLYLNDYISTWHAAYHNIHIKKFANIPEAIYALEQITNGEQIFRRAIELLKDNTSPKILTETKNSPEVINNRDYQLLNYLNHEFRQETSVVTEDNDQVSELQNVISKLSEMHRYLLAIQNSPSPGKAALQAVQLRVNNNGSDPIFEAQQLAKSLPMPLGRWVEELAQETWNTIMVEAIKSLEIEWNEKVVSPFKQFFANRYPFNPTSKLDVPLSEFERFFGYNGTIDNFYQQNLKAFIENNLGIDKSGKPLIRQDIINQIKLAEKIRHTYFTQQGLGMQFSLQPLEMSGNRRRGILNLDGQLVEYRHAGNNAVRLIWPNSMRDNIESRLSLTGGDRATKSIVYNGPWGLIRLINAGKLTNVKNNTFDVRYDIDNSYIIYRIHIDESDNPFAGGLFSKFSLPSTLY